MEEKWVVRSYKGRQKRTGGRVFDQEKPLKAAQEYIAMFKLRHAMMSDAVCTGIGTKLQLLDGQLMESMIDVATNAGVPILPIHDELIVQEKYKKFAEMLLKRAFQSTFKEAGQFGFISAKWTNMELEETIQLKLSL